MRTTVDTAQAELGTGDARRLGDTPVYDDLEVALAEPLEVRILRLSKRETLPEAIAGLRNLEELRLRSGDLRELPRWLASLPRLRKISLQWCHDLTEIPDEILAMPSLRECTVFQCRRLDAYDSKQLTALLGGFARADTGHRTRLLHAALLTGADDRTTGYAPAELVAALNSNVAAVRSAALRLLGERLDADAVRLEPGDRVLLAGTLNADRDVLADRLAGLGATPGSRRPALVVVGDKPGATAARLAAAGVPVILEPHLRSMLDAHAAPHLVAAAGDEPATRLRDLLASTDQANVRLAVELMRTGGVPDGVLEELLLVVQNTDTDPRTRTAARKLFAQYAPQPLQDAVRTVLARTSLYLCGETKLATRLTQLATGSGGAVDPVRLATLMLPERGFTYLFDAGREDPALIVRVLATRRTGDTLDLSTGGLDRIPAEITRLPGLTRIDLSDNRLTGIPEQLCDIATLESLDLSRNRLAAVPDGIDRLVHLRTLDIRDNRFDAFPEAVTRLPALRTLDVSIASWTRHERRPFDRLPETIGDLTRLEDLRLDAHAFETFPESMRRLTRLRRLDLTHARLGHLPEWLADLPALGTLDVAYCEFHDPSGADRLIALLRERGVTVVRR